MKLVMVTLLSAALSTAVFANEQNDTITTDSTTRSTVTTNGTTKIESPPPSAISPNINNSNSDLCTIGVAGAVQTQILGISAGMSFTEDNCIRLKNAKTLYDMGMKVAAVSVMCENRQVFDAMMNAGTPCPYKGMIGEEARLGWENDERNQPEGGPSDVTENGGFLDFADEDDSILLGILGVAGSLALLLVL